MSLEEERNRQSALSNVPLSSDPIDVVIGSNSQPSQSESQGEEEDLSMAIAMSLDTDKSTTMDDSCEQQKSPKRKLNDE